MGGPTTIDERDATDATDGGPWRLAGGRPDRRLGSDVLAYFGYTKRTAGPIVRREVPHGVVALMLGFRGPMDFLPPTGSGPPVDRMVSFVTGLHQVHTHTRHDGRHEGIEIHLTALGASRVLGVPAETLVNSAVPIEAIRGRPAEELVDRLAEAADWPTRFRMLDDVLLRWVDDASPPDPAVRWAWSQLHRSRGRVRVGALADEIGWSRRHLATRFRAGVGLTPKAVGRILRFRRAVELLTSGSAVPISEAAAVCGYSDHSHLVRDFRAMAGCTPSELIADRGGDLATAAVHTTP